MKILIAWLAIFFPVLLIAQDSALKLRKPLTFTVIFSEGDSVFNKEMIKAPSKGENDYIAFIPKTDDTNKAQLFISHESHSSDVLLGDGGGATLLDIEMIDGQWQGVNLPRSINFEDVGGTMENCSGTLVSNGHILSAEEFPPGSNKQLYYDESGTKVAFRDTSNIDGRPRWQNMGWMVDIDLKKLSAVKKLYAMGRFSHEAALILDDNQTVFLTDDYSPSVFFKFVADEPLNFSSGTLYAYRQSANSQSGTWIPLPMQMDSLVKIRDVAINMGATLFQRMEWMVRHENKIYLSETGSDHIDLSREIKAGAKPAAHIKPVGKNHKYDEPYGSILEYDISSERIRQLLKGGAGKKMKNRHFANPDALACYFHSGKAYLIICEDIIAPDRSRTASVNSSIFVNEVFMLDLSINEPNVDDLIHIATFPSGSEPTGPAFSQDYGTLFLNIQHPANSNPAPFNKSTTIAIDGLENLIIH